MIWPRLASVPIRWMTLPMAPRRFLRQFLFLSTGCLIWRNVYLDPNQITGIAQLFVPD
ncbi:hypothetical protein MAB47J26_20306 [Mycobacteroides abscessus 47J26]|nr:hypothetical protein MYCMA_03920 [Mycobacteroides abscessus subsp. massiliense str. GO 06]EHB97405.1 hypothetical protein MAB47J26_20306 [Mycobacteroides abscessus 47J26]